MSFGAITRRPAVLLALGLCFVGVAVSVLGRLATGPRVEATRTPFTAEAGAHSYPAFSPDGKTAAYSGRGTSRDDAYHIYIRPSAGGPPRQLTSGDASDIGPDWSPDAKRLAFLRIDKETAVVMVVPAAGGEPRKVAEFVPSTDEEQPRRSVAWLRDGKRLVVAGATEGQPSALSIVDVDTAALRQITHPAKDTAGDANPVVAPDNGAIAFVRGTGPADHEGGDIYLCDLSGGSVRRLTFDDHPIRGVAWMPDGRELIYSADRGTRWRLWRLPAYGGTPRDLLIAGQQAQFPSISRGGRLLFAERAAASAIWQADLAAPGVPVETLHERPVVRSTFHESNPAFSPDGKFLANVSDQGDDQQIWVGDVDGLSPRYQLTTLPGMRLEHLRWSPDGKRILYLAHSQRGTETYQIEAKAGAKAARILEQGDREASWSHDGKWIYYISNNQIFKAKSDGSGARSLFESQRGASDPEESVDGKYVYYRYWRGSIFRVSSEGGKEEEAIKPEHDLVWAPVRTVKDGLYFMEWVRSERSFGLAFYSYATQKPTDVLLLKNVEQGGGDFVISPDGRHVLYAKTDRNETNLVMVENFR